MRAGRFLFPFCLTVPFTGAAESTAAARVARQTLSAEEFVAARQVSLDMSNYVMDAMKDAVTKQREAKTQLYSATTLNKWAIILPGLFPAGTGPGSVKIQTAAKREIWSDRAGFLKAVAEYQQATAELIARAKANDGPGFKEQLSRVNEACNACHGAYRVPDD